MNIAHILSNITDWFFVGDDFPPLLPILLNLPAQILSTNPVIFLFVVVLPFVGLGIGIIRRLIRIRG